LLGQNLKLTHLPTLLAGLLLFPITTFIGAIRWSLLVGPYNRVVIPIGYTVKQYWIGLVTGFFTPGAIGMDVYRILVISRRYGNYLLNIMAVLMEKFVALFACVLVVIVLYPFIVSFSLSEKPSGILVFAASLMTIAVIFVFLVLLINRNGALQVIARAVERGVSKALHWVATQINLPERNWAFELSLGQMFDPLRKPGTLPVLLLLSVGIQLSSAVVTHVFFRAAGYDISFLINLFLSPVFFLLFVMPVTFAGIGVREASFVILYGFFNVPAETAILVAFFSLAGTLVTNIVGVLFLYSNRQIED
jgi:uncharacterized protein (TIRG00374 family)